MKQSRILLLAVSTLVCVASSSTLAQVPYVIVVSVDGLGSTYLKKIFDRTDNAFPIPNFRRLKAEGASTFAAHIDNDNWETLPNHASIVTGRPRDGASGHGWTSNTDPTTTLHASRGFYISSVFDVVHDNGLSTGMHANKTKFSLFDIYGSYTGGGSYNAVNGALDLMGPDNGRDKVDTTYLNTALGGIIVDTFISKQKSNPKNYSFVHVNETDSFGHSKGWGSPSWNTQVVNVDAMIGKMLKLIEQDVPAMKDNTILIVTADHGNQDNPPTPSDRYSVPIFVWGPGVTRGADLYSINPLNRKVATAYPMTTYAGVQPIRNAEVNNLALRCLGLVPIPGSVFGYAQDLQITMPKPTVSGISPAGEGTLAVRGICGHNGEAVLWRCAQGSLENWSPVQTNSVSAGVSFNFVVPVGTESSAFFKVEAR